ncbi:hypothetical protein RFI_31854 [Reticulomyxa filosa]|uniref:Protein kinase domain-containing protein n=1 Tax=Reticulomyxa filosa TaxID=46433 RepID=X6LXT3_RETFI|nr:hypothetical protein RFI_31854 [Reticulomyxa filosa]|eukprot:ETO05545.1 hypothetical protein RFI_31854 [Reticulomyxa filosa]
MITEASREETNFGNKHGEEEQSNAAVLAPKYSCNDKGFMEFSEKLVIGKRYVLQKPKAIEELELEHGKGRYGSVYCVFDKKENNVKAVKILKIPEEDGDDNYIRRELRVLKRISRTESDSEEKSSTTNPFVIKLLDYGRYKSHSYFLFDYLEVTLQQHFDYVLHLNYQSVKQSDEQMLDKHASPHETSNHGSSNRQSTESPNQTSQDNHIHLHKRVLIHPFDVWIIFFQLLHALSC